MSDAREVFISVTCEGERCFCGQPAVRKVGEEIPYDDPLPHRHNLTSYVCAEHFTQIMGPCGARDVGLTSSYSKPASTTAERERDEARALATERLEALRPFAAVFHGRHMKDDPPPTLVGLLVGVTARHMAAGDLDGLSCGHFGRAAALTSEADHGG